MLYLAQVPFRELFSPARHSPRVHWRVSQYTSEKISLQLFGSMGVVKPSHKAGIWQSLANG